MSEGFVREPAHHRVPWRPLTSAVLAPLVWFNDSALEHRSVGFQVLSDGLETELVEAAERGQAGRIKSRVGHVEVFRMGSVGTSIFRETSTPTRTATRSTDYTLVREEPLMRHDSGRTHASDVAFWHLDPRGPSLRKGKTVLRIALILSAFAGLKGPVSHALQPQTSREEEAQSSAHRPRQTPLRVLRNAPRLRVVLPADRLEARGSTAPCRELQHALAPAPDPARDSPFLPSRT
ncbi:hypothetical protein FB108_2132 [Brevibacterium jeotgali]|nr:hypothetical protein FB108_2132 [Brevibacterium jeotgali]